MSAILHPAVGNLTTKMTLIDISPAVLSSSNSTPAPIWSNNEGIPPPIILDMLEEPIVVLDELEDDIIDEELDIIEDELILDDPDIMELMSPPIDII